MKALTTLLISGCLAIVCVVGLVYFLKSDALLLIQSDSQSTSAAAGNHIEKTEPVVWKEYINEEFHFSMQRPDTWRVTASGRGDVPLVTIYPKDTPGTSKKAPFDPSINTTHVSFYPLGIPHEELWGKQKRGSFEGNVAMRTVDTFLLEDDAIYLTKLTPVITPEGWGPSGFILGRIYISRLSETCIRNGQGIAFVRCDPLFGDRVQREGELDSQSVQIITHMLKSISFLAASTTEEVASSTEASVD